MAVVATYISKDLKDDWEILCKNCGLTKPSDVLRFAIKQAAATQDAQKTDLKDFKKQIEGMGLPELEKRYKAMTDKGKQSLTDKKAGVWHYDIFFNDLRTFIEHQAPIEEIIAYCAKAWEQAEYFKEICLRKSMKLKTWDDNHRQHTMKYSNIDETYVKLRSVV
jgi:hypothetical protein